MLPADETPLGTDGAQLSFKGLPCPNLGTGGHGYHGPYKHIMAEGIEAACRIALKLVKIYADRRPLIINTSVYCPAHTPLYPLRHTLPISAP